MARTGGSATRARILAVAMQRYGEAGYEATSLDEVARSVGVRKQTLLYYFPTKADLFAAAAAEAARLLASSLEGALEEYDPGGLDRIPVFVEAGLRLASERPEVLGMIREVVRIGPPVSDRVASALRPLVDSAVAWLERGMEEGTVRRQNARIALFTIYSAVIGHLTESTLERAILDDEARASATQELVSFLRAALAPPSPSK